MRLRTLPLSLSGIIVGSAMAYYYGGWNFHIFILSISTTVLFQILSNLANDLGDSQKGTDNDERIGPTRAIQSGLISQSSMKNAVAPRLLLKAPVLDEGDLVLELTLHAPIGVAAAQVADKRTVHSGR